MAKTPEDERSTIGYGRPPIDFRFKKGKSGNPGGRPKKMKNEFDSKIIHLMESNVSPDSTITDVILKGLTREAAKGNIKATKLLLEYYLAARRNHGKTSVTDEADREAGKRILGLDSRRIADLLGEPQRADDIAAEEGDDNAN